MPRVLLLGFDPDPGAPADASSDATRTLAESWAGEADIVARGLPRVFDEAPRRMRAHIAKHLPDAVLLVASAPGSVDVAVERLAVNLDDATVADAAGREPVDRPVVPGAEAALWSTLPVRDIVGHLQQTGVPARLSLSAGSDVSNHTFYSLQRELSDWAVPSGLIHVPASPEMQVEGVPTVPTAAIAAALRTVVEAVLAALEAEAPADETPVGDEDAEETQPYLMPIAEPIASAPVSEDEPDAELEAEPEPEPEPEPDPAEEAAPDEIDIAPVEIDVEEPLGHEPVPVPALEPDAPAQPEMEPVAVAVAPSLAAPAPAVQEAPVQEAPQEEPVPTAESEPESEPQQRPMTWEEIITGGRG